MEAFFFELIWTPKVLLSEQPPEVELQDSNFHLRTDLNGW